MLVKQVHAPDATNKCGGTIPTMGNSPNPIPSFARAAGKNEQSGPPIVPIAIGAATVLIVIGILIFFGRKSGNENVAPGTADPYAANLVVSGEAMSSANNFAGQQVTYIEGKLTNNGSKTVTSALLQTTFHDSLGQVAQKDTQRLMVITTREPYIDTAPLNSAPLKPGQTREFRQTFEHVTADWNMQAPDLAIVKTSTE
jgi:hypothetical protein